MDFVDGGRLMGAHEIRTRLGEISRQRAFQITHRSGFPKPVIELAQGHVWDGDAVEKWIEQWRPWDFPVPRGRSEQKALSPPPPGVSRDE